MFMLLGRNPFVGVLYAAVHLLTCLNFSVKSPWKIILVEMTPLGHETAHSAYSFLCPHDLLSRQGYR